MEEIIFADIIDRKFNCRLKEFSYKVRLNNEQNSQAKWYRKEELKSISEKVEKYDEEIKSRKLRKSNSSYRQQPIDEEELFNEPDNPSREWQKFTLNLIKNQMMLLDVVINRDGKLEIDDLRAIKQELYYLSSKIKQHQVASLTSLKHKIEMSEQNQGNVNRLPKVQPQTYPNRTRVINRNFGLRDLLDRFYQPQFEPLKQNQHQQSKIDEDQDEQEEDEQEQDGQEQDEVGQEHDSKNNNKFMTDLYLDQFDQFQDEIVGVDFANSVGQFKLESSKKKCNIYNEYSIRNSSRKSLNNN